MPVTRLTGLRQALKVQNSGVKFLDCGKLLQGVGVLSHAVAVSKAYVSEDDTLVVKEVSVGGSWDAKTR
jgi:hypothetical protein